MDKIICGNTQAEIERDVEYPQRIDRSEDRDEESIAYLTANNLEDKK